MQVLIDQRRIQDIPVLEFYNPQATARLPVVILMHGFSGRKEHCFSQGYQLARCGYYAVAIDLYLHGEASDGEFVPARVAPHLAEVIERSVDYIRQLIAVYARDPIADGNRIGLLGLSLGGVVIYHYLPHRAAAVRTAAVQIAGAPPFWPITMRKIMAHYPELGVTEELIALSEQRQPPAAPFLEGVADFPLLMQYGQADPIVPIEEVRRLHAQVKSGYARSDRIELVEYPDTGHETPPAMFAYARQWFDRYLQAPESRLQE